MYKYTCHKLGVIVRELTRVQSSCRMCQYHERGLHANVLSEILALDTNIRLFETQRILVGSNQKKSLEKLVPKYIYCTKSLNTGLFRINPRLGVSSSLFIYVCIFL
jgi:hypothetical protein